MSVEGGGRLLPGLLASLKHDGGSILVVGGPDGQRALCERLGGSDALDREHIALETGGDHGCCCTSPGPDATAEFDARHPAAVAGSGSSPSVPGLSGLASRVITEIDTHAATHHPGKLRLCLGPVDPLVDATDPTRVSLFLDAICERVRQASGMTHVHVTAPPDSDLVARLTPQFDAVLECRADPDPQQRWHLPTRDATTAWIPVED